MKNITTILLILAYLAVFIVAGKSFNPFEWDDNTRTVFCLMTAVAILGTLMIMYLEGGEQGHD